MEWRNRWSNQRILRNDWRWVLGKSSAIWNRRLLLLCLLISTLFFGSCAPFDTQSYFQYPLILESWHRQMVNAGYCLRFPQYWWCDVDYFSWRRNVGRCCHEGLCWLLYDTGLGIHVDEILLLFLGNPICFQTALDSARHAVRDNRFYSAMHVLPHDNIFSIYNSLLRCQTWIIRQSAYICKNTLWCHLSDLWLHRHGR